jgi:NADH:ubiquinone oxidoreductase subunit 6 (subunit J)
MQSVLGVPLALVLIAAGIVVLVASKMLHWVLLILALALIAVGAYFFFTGQPVPI